ncbi:CoA transferase [Candidatus Bathyarchaeota archaeon]|nr:MAG: CoA transferase [Candidatus Bathyarchaeota archaeon]
MSYTTDSSLCRYRFEAWSMGKILDDIRVLDLTHVWFGPWCTMMLADMGAEVIRIEPPWGAIDRIAEGARFGGVSYTFHHLNLNKKNLTLNLKAPEGVAIFKELVKRSDVVVQNFRPGTMERLGLGYDVLRELNPGIIYAALSGFGQYGPYSSRGAYAMIAEAMSGHTRLTGDRVDPEGPPIEMAQAYGDLGPGTMAAMAIIAAIRYRDRTGVGQMIDVAQLDCMVAYNTAITGYTLSGMKPWELRKKYSLGRGVGGLMQTKDGGWIRMAAYSPKAIDNLKKALETDVVDREMVEKRVAEMTRDEAVDFFVKAKIPVAPVYHVDEVVRDPHLAARGMFVEVEHPKAGRVKVPNFPVKFSETPGEIVSAAPLLGQHNKEILMGLLGYTEERIAELERAGIIASET